MSGDVYGPFNDYYGFNPMAQAWMPWHFCVPQRMLPTEYVFHCCPPSHQPITKELATISRMAKSVEIL